MTARRARVLGAISIVVAGAGWEAAAWSLDSLLLPGCLDTLAALAELIFEPRLWRALWVSNQALVLGYALAVVVGVPIGIAAARWRVFERGLDPYLVLLLATPMAALGPLLIATLGLGLLARAAVVFVFAVAVVVINTRAGFAERHVWRHVRLPAAVPAIMSGLRIGQARALDGMVVVELLLAAGVGGLILQFQGDFESAAVFAVVLAVLGEAVLLSRAAQAVERRMARWYGGASIG